MSYRIRQKCRITKTKQIFSTAIVLVAVSLLAAFTTSLRAQQLQGQEKATPSVRTDLPSSLIEASQVTTTRAGVLFSNKVSPSIRTDAQKTVMSQGSPLWDNDLVTDGVNGRAMSPPLFPDIRVADDFVIPDGEEWNIQDFHFNAIEDDTWTDGGIAEIYIYDDNGNSPGSLIISISNLPFSKVDTGDVFFGRVDYEYSIENLSIPLGPGRYWIGTRFPNGGGSGTNWWMTSTGQPDGPDTSGWLSLDAGATWNIEGDPDWDHAFTVTGIVVGQGSPLWDNDLIPDGVNGRAISPPGFPDIRVVDDFVIPNGEQWIIQDFHFNAIEDDPWTDGGIIEIYIYDDNGNSPGSLIINISNLPFSKVKTGDEYFGRLDYEYSIVNLSIPLGPGRYWIGTRCPNGGGAGTNWWMTSTGQPDGPDTSGWVSFDAGTTWDIEGDPDWDHAFTVTGIVVGQGSNLWDNDLVTDGVSGRAMSPPLFPDIRVADDFVIPDDEEWIIQDFHFNAVEGDAWTDGGVAEIYIYDDNGNSPGSLIINISNLPFSKVDTGDVFFGRVDYEYSIVNLSIPLGPGRYWIGTRFPNGGGSDSNWWMTSTGQPDGPDTSGWFSLDAGTTWNIEGDPDWDHAFTVTGIIANSCPWDLDDSGAVSTGDLLILFSQWGTDGPADFDDSGAVGTGDLLILFVNWGPCP